MPSRPAAGTSLRVPTSAACAPSTVLGRVRGVPRLCPPFPAPLLSPWAASVSLPRSSLCLPFSPWVSQPLSSAFRVSLFSPSLLSFIFPPTPPPPVELGTRQKLRQAQAALPTPGAPGHFPELPAPEAAVCAEGPRDAQERRVRAVGTGGDIKRQSGLAPWQGLPLAAPPTGWTARVPGLGRVWGQLVRCPFGRGFLSSRPGLPLTGPASLSPGPGLLQGPEGLWGPWERGLGAEPPSRCVLLSAPLRAGT